MLWLGLEVDFADISCQKPNIIQVPIESIGKTTKVQISKYITEFLGLQKPLISWR
jgi:hypothetical protein